MLERTHEHITSELQQNARTDTTFMVAAIFFDLIIWGINWNAASSYYYTNRTFRDDLQFWFLIFITILINGFAVRALLAGRSARLKLINSLISMYRDNGVDKYYDPSLLITYSDRYWLFTAIIIVWTAPSIFIPLIERYIKF